MSQNFDDGEPIDEQGTQQAHEQVRFLSRFRTNRTLPVLMRCLCKAYGQGNAGQLGAKSMGAAAAMQALKKFTQGGGSTSGGNTQSALIGQGELPTSLLPLSTSSSVTRRVRLTVRAPVPPAIARPQP